MGIVIATLVLGGLVAGLVWQHFFNADARIKRALRGVARTAMRDVRDGAVGKVVGTLAYVGEPLVAPLTRRTCAYYLVLVEAWRSTGRSGYWAQIVREERRQDFALRDADGTRALVHIADARVSVVRDASFTSGTFKDPTPELEAFMSARGLTTRGWVFNKSIRYMEGVLEAGESIAVGGLARWEPDPDPGATGGAYREAPKRLVLAGSSQLPLLISDDASTL
jgi:hypothetical protein